MKNIPKKIYLNLGMDEIEVENVKDFNELREVTWCKDRQSESDIEYQLLVNSKWININDFIPEDYLRVLWIDNRDSKINIGYFVPSQTKIPEYVTHWMNLPNVPGLEEQTNESD